MFTINSVSKKILKISALVVCVFGIITTAITIATRQSDHEVDAISADGSTVVIGGNGIWITYGTHGTYRYNATIGGVTYQGYCANPSLSYPAGNREVQIPTSNATNNAIQLLTYISLVNPTSGQALMNELYSWVFDSWVDEFGFFPENDETLPADGNVKATTSDRVYTMVHATIGTYTNDYGGINGDGDYTHDDDYARVRGLLDAAASRISQLVANNARIWQEAQNYQLMGVKMDTFWEEGVEYTRQNVVWLEPKYGNIEVRKCDAETRTCTAQGDASLQGIKFEVYNGNTKVAEGTTNASGKVTFSNLPIATYTVKEVSSNTSYNLDTASGTGLTATISTNGETKTLTFYDTVKKGKITIYKNDKETGSCDKLGAATFAGNRFSITNNSTNSIKYGDSTIAKGSVVTTVTMSANCSVTVYDLPYGSYIISETAAGTGYLLNSSTQSFTIPTNGSFDVTKTFTNQVKRGDLKFVKRDSNNNKVMANVPFKIESNTTHEWHIVVSDPNGVVDTSAVNHDINPYGYDNYTASQLYNVTYQGYGTWFGGGTIDNNLGALPYDTYTITEISCLNSVFCYNAGGATKTVTISENNVTENLGNWNNDCAVFGIETTATDNTDGDKFIEVGSSVTVKDEIVYDVRENLPYKIVGTLMDKTTNQAIKTVTIDNFTPTTAHGTTYMTFTIDTREIAGHDLVVFEKLYYNNELVASHENLESPSQTVTVVSLKTTAVDNDDEDKFVEASTSSTVKDTVEYCVKPGLTYAITGKLMEVVDNTTVRPLVINGQEVTASTTITPTRACDSVELDFTFDSHEIAGKTLVAYETLKLDGAVVISHENMQDEAQTVYVISLRTMATDTHDGDQVIDADIEDSNIKDTIHYCLKKGETYTIKGILMNKNTMESLKVDGQEITKTIQITPTEACYQTSMIFDLDVSRLGGTEIVVFETVEYQNRDIITHADWDDADQAVNVFWVETLATDNSDGDQILVDETKTTVRDIIDYCLKAGKSYTIKSIMMNTKDGLPLEIDGKKMEASVDITPTSNCGYVEVYFDVDPSKLAGLDIVMFEELYYEGRLVLEHNALYDYRETFSVLSLSTTAVDAADGDKLLEANGDITINDKVDYCLMRDKTFTIEGVVMNKTTKEILLIDGKPIKQTITITPEEACGSTVMTYSFNTTDLGGAELVIFESLYYDGDLILAHKDFENEPETVSVLLPPPDTGLITSTSDGSRTEIIKTALFVVLFTTGGYVVYRRLSGKKLFGHHHIDFNK